MSERRMVAGGTTRRFTATRWTRRAAVGAMLGVVASCAGKRGDSDADTSASAAASDTSRSAEGPAVSGAGGAGGAGDTAWVALVDAGASQWRGYKRQDLPAAWKVVGDTLAFTPVADTSQRGDIVTREQYGDFEFAYEW